MRRFLLTLVLILCAVNIFSQETFEKAEALFIYNFTKNFEWSSSNENFTIIVLDDVDLYSELTTFMSNKSVKNKKIIVRKVSNISDIKDAEIVIIGNRSRALTKDIKTIADANQILTINSGDNKITDYACLGFKMIDNKLKFVIHKKNIRDTKVVMSASLENLAIVLD